MTHPGSRPGRSVHPQARWGFGMAIAALLLALYGSYWAEKHIAGSPLIQARGTAGLPAQPRYFYERAVRSVENRLFGMPVDRFLLHATERSRIARYTLQIVAFYVPLALGLLAVRRGSHAMAAIEQERDRYAGNFHAVFAIMIGSLSAIVAACMLFSYYLWPLLPALDH